MLNEKNRYVNILTDIVYLAVLAAIGYICFKLFGMMIVNLDGNYRTDFHYYIWRATDGWNGAYRFTVVVFRLLYLLTGTVLSINIYMAVQIVLIILSNHAYIHYYSGCDTKNTGCRVLVHVLSIAALMAGPIYVPGIHRAFYRNTFASFAWHSPTQQMMTLFVILGTICLFKMLDGYEEKVSVKWWIGTTVFYFLSAYSKPNFIIDIAPAIVIVFLIELFIQNGVPFGRKFLRLFVMGCAFVPSGVYMLILHYHLYEDKAQTVESDIIVNSSKFTEYEHIWVAVVCCLAFALIVMLFNIVKIFKDRRYRIILLSALCGFLQWGLLDENGDRAGHGNFEWGCIIGCYMLTLTCIAISVENLRDENFLWGKKWLRVPYFILLAGALALQVASQTYYFYTMYMGAGYYR